MSQDRTVAQVWDEKHQVHNSVQTLDEARITDQFNVPLPKPLACFLKYRTQRIIAKSPMKYACHPAHAMDS